MTLPSLFSVAHAEALMAPQTHYALRSPHDVKYSPLHYLPVKLTLQNVNQSMQMKIKRKLE